ncbi:MAG: SagB/ThcOx family dehydrogenase [Candidatus Omnitrophota bacterium]|nr:SagB/ThcOx family dehydrogenase [Candidatus Omnitrophota bacterium]
MKKKIFWLCLLLLLSFFYICWRLDFLPVNLKRRDPNTGKRFHAATKMVWGEFWKNRSVLTDNPVALLYKIYPDVEKIKLPPPNYAGKQLEASIKKVLPDGSFSGEAISLDELSQILFSADGIIKKDDRIDIRTAPVPLPQTGSFSHMHPVEIYVLARNVSGVKKGLYHYSALEHSLELIDGEASQMPNCCFEQSVVDNSAVAIILTGIPSRLTWAHDTRSYRYMYMAAGAVSQNIYLECASLGLISSATASFHDDLYNKMLGIDGENEVTLLLHLVGKIKE